VEIVNIIKERNTQVESARDPHKQGWSIPGSGRLWRSQGEGG